MKAEKLEEYEKAVDALRVRILFCEEEGADASALGPLSEQHLLIALATLEQARAHLALAKYHCMRKD